MSDAILAQTDKEEALSRAYAATIAASAGYTLAVQDFDRDGVDVQFRAGGSMRPSLDVQLKATINLTDGGDEEFRYALRRRNYDLLREVTLVPRILVVLELPKEESSWINVNNEELAIRRCAYWVSLLGFPETNNSDSVTVSIKKRNRFDVASLKSLMEQARRGAIT
ncbi:DUF4365 domain-containing protein [Cypionkella sp. TWP1-2-1b2]|uniref:DUF4365 domain-containing protein n=1 Tax=Cypionkella sp. TWP1-2-1b2 TaxID=2804675 RepID=UPI003CED0AFF